MKPLWLLLLLLAACDGPPLVALHDAAPEPDATPPAPIELGLLDDELGFALCERLYDCCLVTERGAQGTFPEAGGTLNTCTQGVVHTLFTSGVYPDAAARVMAGSAAYDPVAAGACVAAVRQRSCSELYLWWGSGQVLDCLGPPVITGLVADGQACAADLDCAPASSCEAGLCAPRPDGACSHVCQDGLSCQGGACLTPAAGFEPCADDEDCADRDCDEDAGQCRKPFACRRS